MKQLKVFAGTASRILAEEVCALLSIPLGKAIVGRFHDGEVRVRLEENVRDADVFIVNSTHPPAENFFETILLYNQNQIPYYYQFWDHNNEMLSNLFFCLMQVI